MENDHLAVIALEVGALPELPRCANELPEMAVPLPFTQCLEEEQIFSVWNMISNRLVAADELHIADLAFSGIQEDVLFAPSILVAVLLSRFSSEQEQERLVGGR